jgi:hypothetical protein
MLRWKRTGLLLMVVGLAGVLLAFSIWKNVEDQALRLVLPKGVIVNILQDKALAQFAVELPTETGVLPHELGYAGTAGYERMRLWLIQDEEREFDMLLELADKRMKAVQVLFGMGKGEMALKTAVKGVYYWEAAYRLLTHHDQDKA